ncbi:hypothetical protein ACIHDR_42990 [Nocardia sp. NPDC052278]|uniref:hypothetical protein n=1 Tax=unclassified Nocardia TaxID=2637762 RepID=UPI0036AE5F45
MNVDEMITVHQLLGRIAYFHIAFIEPALANKPRPAHPTPVQICCRHRPDKAEQPAPLSPGLADTAWAVPIDIAASLRVRVCRSDLISCCARCLIRHSAAAIADAWLEVETTTYADLVPPKQQRAEWCARIGAQLAEVFDEEFGGACALEHPDIGRCDDPPRDRFPLVCELMVLWDRPIGHQPVTSWLNHCADLADITRVLHTRRGHERAIVDRTR